eukprot:TRINITY_DN1587_c0_g1_i1.p2 TRINITY_DN1587_c0_g1~~TRINITY_DN1587_c0_g1_i1.p2  ORF type:complete len:323 (+),score=90.38 TRINITY_DN1587_c0_g1_i1:26-970(+)
MGNPGIPLDLGWVHSARVNKSATERRAAEIGTRRSIKKLHQLAWLLRSLRCIDLTTLAGDDTPSNVKRLCAKARNPVHIDTLRLLGIENENITVGAVCVYPNRVKDAVAALEGSNIPVASVATGFPAGQTPLETRLSEIRLAVAAGAREIDIVIPRTAALLSDWQGLYDEVKAMKEACGSAHLKTILATGELPTYQMVYQCSAVCLMAGADFIKTSTGKEPVNATLPVALVMCRAIRDYYDRTGVKVGFKPAGGIRTAKQAMAFLALMMEELGEEWTHPDLFRFGASSLLGDIERQLYHGTTGRYHAPQYIPMG